MMRQKMKILLCFFILLKIFTCMGQKIQDELIDESDIQERSLTNFYQTFIGETKPRASVMFWRPQKVGSSTMLSLLVSYAFRYQIQSKPRESPNVLCTKIAKCAINSEQFENKTLREYQNYIRRWASKARGMIPPELDTFQMSLSHEICHLPTDIIDNYLQCAFRSNDKPREFIVVRNPLKRALSIYYFWGELWKMRNRLSEQSKGRGRGQKWEKGKSHRHMTEITLQNAQHGNTLSVEEPPIQLGSSIGRNTTPIRGPLFTYHGDEFSAPSEDIAMAYATRLPLIPGMPGPSLTWSCYGRTVEEAIQGFNAPFHSSSHQKGKADPRYRISPVVTERLDESLIVLSDHLSWSIADMVNVVPRKSLSSHPSLSSWPNRAVHAMNASLVRFGEWDYYEAANLALNKRIEEIKQKFLRTGRERFPKSFEGRLSFDEKLHLLQRLREKVTEYCLSSTALTTYQKFLSDHLSQHPKGNKLRDVPQEYVSQGHCFSLGTYERELIYSFDVCSGCESHAIMRQLQEAYFQLKEGHVNDLQSWIASQMGQVVSISNWKSQGRNDIDFQYCPIKRKES